MTTLSRPSSPAPVPRTQELVFVHTSTSPNPSSKSSSGSRSGSHSSNARPTSPLSRTADHNRSFDEWMAAYGANKLGLRPDQVPAPPPAILAILAEEEEMRSSSPASHQSGDVMYLYSNSNGSAPSINSAHSEEPLTALERFRLLGHLQAPPPPFEEERLKLASKFGLEQPRRRAALDSICKLAKRHFGMKTVVISLTFEDSQVLAGEVGWGGEEPGPDAPPRPLTLAPAMCTHALISAPDPAAEDSTFIVGNANEDWRFSKNPYTTGMGGGLAYYAAANVMLEVDEKDQLERDLPPSLPVGAICLIDDQPRDPAAFTDEDRSMLREFANMIARELTLGHEQRRRDAEIRQSDFLGSFLNSAIVLPDKAQATKTPTTSAPTNLDAGPSSLDNPRFPPIPSANASPATHAVFAPVLASGIGSTATFALAAEKLNALTDAESTAIFDLRSFRAPVSQDSPELGPAEQERRRHASFSRDYGGQGKLYLMSSSGNVDWKAIAGQEQLLGMVNDALTEYDASSTVIFDTSSRVQPLLAVLPSSVTSTICLPLFDVDGTPALLIVLTSTVKHFSFIESDVRFSRNVGAITMGYLLRQRAEQADRAKLAFVSQISHELRTPLHGINSQVELIREFSTPSQLRRLAPLLDTAEVCLESLRDVLDDTLDFAKLTSSTTSEEERQRAHARAVSPTNLEQLLEDVSKATWVRKKRTDLATAEVGAPNAPSQPPRTPVTRVDLILEVEERAAGWTGLFDLGAMKRVLLNLLGNALKFTQYGHVKLSLRELPRRPRPADEENWTTIRLDVEDTGRGMNDEFVRNKLFTPFVQENPFANGAGLGMSICQTIIRRMGGEISVRSVQGQGTKISITLPAEMLAEDPQPPTPFALSSSTSTPSSFSSFSTSSVPNGDHSSLFRTRIISQELATLFNPGPAHLVLSSSPRSEIKEIDFSQAVEAAAASKTFVRLPSTRRPRKGSVLGRQGDQEDLVVEAAKLGYATVLAAEEGAASAMEPPAAAPQQEQEGPRKVRVLVADDNPIARNIFTKLFTVKGIPFEQAENGLEAVNLFKAAHAANRPFDLFVTDVQMPVMDGVEAAWAVRSYENEGSLARCRVIALTGLSNEEDLRNQEDGIDLWVVKGGRSMRIILDQIGDMQRDLDSGPL